MVMRCVRKMSLFCGDLWLLCRMDSGNTMEATGSLNREWRWCHKLKNGGGSMDRLRGEVKNVMEFLW